VTASRKGLFAWFRGRSRWQEPPSRIAFLHIPKTAGTSVGEVLTHRQGSGRVYARFDRSLFGDFGAFDAMDPAFQDLILHDPAKADHLADTVMGHMALSTLRTAWPGHALITVLREPRNRVLSHWMFWRGQDDASLSGWGPWADRVRLARGSWHDFLTARPIACHTDNLMVRMLVWPDPRLPDDDFIPEDAGADLLRKARKRLAGLDLALLLEDPEFSGKLGRFLGHAIVLPVSNRTRDLSADLQIAPGDLTDPAARAALDRRTRLDHGLWLDLACAIWRRQAGHQADAVHAAAIARVLGGCSRRG
jgi:hypothetical protein